MVIIVFHVEHFNDISKDRKTLHVEHDFLIYLGNAQHFRSLWVSFAKSIAAYWVSLLKVRLGDTRWAGWLQSQTKKAA